MNIDKIIKQEAKARLERRAIAQKFRQEARRKQVLWGIISLGAVFLGYGIALNTNQQSDLLHTSSNRRVITTHTATANNGSIAVSGGNVNIKSGFDLYELIDDIEIPEPPPLPPRYKDI